MFKKIQEKVLDIISSGSDYVIPTAALALGVLNAEFTEEEVPEKSEIIEKLFGLTEQGKKEEKIMLGTFAAIGLGFAHSSEIMKKKEKEDFSNFATAQDFIKEATAISAGLGSIPEPQEIIYMTIQDKALNVNFGACVGYALYLLKTGNVLDNLNKHLEQLIGSTYYDVASVALICYGLRPLNEKESKESIKKVEKFINANEDYEKRIAAIISSSLMSINLADKIKAMTNSHKYLREGSWAIMATYPTYAWLLLSEKEPLTPEKFDNYPINVLPPEMIYDYNGIILLSAFLFSIADEEMKKIIINEIIGNLSNEIQQFGDTKFVYLATKGLIAQFTENPKEEFLKLLNDEFSPILENEADDWDQDRLKLGATLGIGFGIFMSRILSGIDDELLEVAYPLLEKALVCKNGTVQKAAIMSLLAITTKPEIYLKYLLISSFYELDQADYTYYKIAYLIIVIYFILFNKFYRS